MVDFKTLIQAGVHFGHRRSRWCPKMAPYIWGYRNDIHLIDVSKTAYQLEKAAQFLEQIASQGKTIFWVGTKKPAQEIIRSVAQELNCPYVTHRWIGGTLTNYLQVKKSITKLLHYEDILAKADQSFYTKKELSVMQKIVNRLKSNVGGFRTMSWPIGALVIIDVRKEQAALKEAATLKVPVIALVDTNCDPSLVDYVIPANDDSTQAIKLIANYLAAAVKRGKEKATVRPQQEQQPSEGISEESPVVKFAAEDEESPENAKRVRVRKTKELPKQKADGAPHRKPEARKK